MTYFPHSNADINQMLKSIGKSQLEDLADPIPDQFKIKALNLEKGKDELTLAKYFSEIKNKNSAYQSIFMGGGAYHHYIPAVIDELAGRQEFYTAYTPYQAEVSQGTLQAIFEYQTYLTQLTGLDVSNASLYDGGTALAEAVILAVNQTRKKKILVDQFIHPEYLAVLRTYCRPLNIEITLYQSDAFTFNKDLFLSVWNQDFACFVIASPNYAGSIIDYSEISAEINKSRSLLIHCLSEILSLGVLKSPGQLGAHIACGEAQSLGIPLSFGGPYLGFLTCTQKLVRKMPGRIVGQTKDKNDRIAYTLTLATREQHIRRESATSNICTNNGLCALRASIYLSLLGYKGLRNCALKNIENTRLLSEKIAQLDHFTIKDEQIVFNEFVVQSDIPYQKIKKALEEAHILSFYPLEQIENHYLVCATEMNTRQEIKHFINTLEKIS